MLFSCLPKWRSSCQTQIYRTQQTLTQQTLTPTHTPVHTQVLDFKAPAKPRKKRNAANYTSSQAIERENTRAEAWRYTVALTWRWQCSPHMMRLGRLGSKLLIIRQGTGGTCDQQTDTREQGEHSIIIPRHSKAPIGWAFNVCLCWSLKLSLLIGDALFNSSVAAMFQ